jgi:septum formation protein
MKNEDLGTSSISLILASSSIYRQRQLKQLGIPFQSMKPLCDEDSLKNHFQHLPADQLARELAYQKAFSLQKEVPKSSLLLGADQLVQFQGQILGKPHTRENAVEQLLRMAGKTHQLITAVCLLQNEHRWNLLNVTALQMYPMSRQEIETYVDLDLPFDCAGSYKIEENGIRLFEKIETPDFTAIQGLPLLQLHQILRSWNFKSTP